ncbi:hypothetical protein SAY86_006035 [Trapa natans]|uniref:Uncharacterized protein n=1 Tax=Trapa natans TaxID=22666 RepID=A0AAN7LCU3_TRANT|nr:hypothetical protein SAY86_006035 [Trapa natans]
MAPNVIVSTDVIEATSTCFREGDPSFTIRSPRDQELGIGSTSSNLIGALAPEKNDRTGISSDSAAKVGFAECQESENFCGIVVSDVDRVQEVPLDPPGLQRAHLLNDLEAGSSSKFDKSWVDGMIDASNGAECLLEVKKKQLLDELEMGSIFKGISPSEHPGERALIIENFPDLGFMRSSEEVDDYLGSSLKIEVIDDTAVIEPIAGSRILNETKSNSREDAEGKNTAKRTRRKGQVRKTGSEKAEYSAQVSWKSGGDGAKIVYSREEMEALRFVGVAEQKKLWKEIYNALGPAVAKEYMSLSGSKHHQQQGKSSSESPRPLRRSTRPGVLGAIAGTGRANPLTIFVLPYMLSTSYSTN